MPANESIPFKEPGSALTIKATAAITGKRFVKLTGNRTGGGAGGLSSDLANVYQGGPCDTIGERALGVAKYDAANGSLVGVHSQPGIIVPVTAGATLAAGDLVMTDAAGKAIPFVQDVTPAAGAAAATKRALGLALTGAAANADAEIKLF
jgi:hypothetical protein